MELIVDARAEYTDVRHVCIRNANFTVVSSQHYTPLQLDAIAVINVFSFRKC